MIIDSLRWTASAACFFLLLGTRSVLAQPAFVEANATAGITDTGETFGTAWADLNSDGFPDIWLDKHQYTPTVIYINQGDGTFLESIEDFDESWGVLGLFEGRTDTHGVGSADFDNDGDVDMLEITGANWRFPFWVNDGTGRLTDRSAEFGFIYPYDPAGCRRDPCGFPIGGRGPVWLDYDNDGDLDVMAGARLNDTFYQQPAAMFRQDVVGNQRTFTYDGSTGVNYASRDNCAYGVMAEFSGDDTLELICGSPSRIDNVWDTTQLPFTDLVPQLGAAVNTFVTDLAVGDFNGDLRSDFFAPRRSLGAPAGLAMKVGDRTVHARFVGDPPDEGSISFLAEGKLLVDFEWGTSVSGVFIGASATNPPASADLSVYNGWRNHVQLLLDPNDPANQGLGSGTAGGTYIGRVGGRWHVRFVSPDPRVSGLGEPAIAARADVSVSGLRSEGGMTVGQPADIAPVLLLQNASHQLVDASGQIAGPLSSCLSAAPGDFDNDGDLDVYVGCSGDVANLDNILYENDGQGNFTAITGTALGDARGDIYGRMDAVLTADYDLDGRLDLFVTNGNYPRPFSYSGRHQLFRNVTANGNHWVEIDLQGVTSNRDGIGARVFASTPDGKVQLREQGNGMHRYTQNHQRLHIGLGPNQRVDIEVRWPSGVVDEFANLGADKLYALVEGTGGGGVSGCGAPTYDPAVDGGLYLWEESCGNATRSFTVRAAGGGSASTVTYAGQVDANQAFNLVSPFSLESTDVLVNSGSQIVYEMNVRSRYQDGFGFGIASSATVCFGLDLPAGTPVLVGPNATPVAAPFDLTTYQACAAPPVAEICGAPTYDPATDAGLYLWEESCGGSGHAYRVRASAGGSTTVVTYAGDVTSNQTFVAVAPYSLENTDVLTSTGLRIDYGLNVRQTYQDGFDFSTTDAASVCFGLDLPAGTPVRVGSGALTVTAPFSLPELGVCTP